MVQEKIVDKKTYYIYKNDYNNEKGMWVMYKLEDYNFSKFQAKKGKKYKGSEANPLSKLKMCTKLLTVYLSLLQWQLKE